MKYEQFYPSASLMRCHDRRYPRLDTIQRPGFALGHTWSAFVRLARANTAPAECILGMNRCLLTKQTKRGLRAWAPSAFLRQWRIDYTMQGNGNPCFRANRVYDRGHRCDPSEPVKHQLGQELKLVRAENVVGPRTKHAAHGAHACREVGKGQTFRDRVG